MIGDIYNFPKPSKPSYRNSTAAKKFSPFPSPPKQKSKFKMYIYSNKEDENDPHKLPDVEVWHSHQYECEVEGFRDMENPYN